MVLKKTKIKNNRDDIDRLYNKLEENSKDLEEVQIYLDYDNGYTINELAEKYELSPSTIRRRIGKYIKK